MGYMSKIEGGLLCLSIFFGGRRGIVGFVDKYIEVFRVKYIYLG